MTFSKWQKDMMQSAYSLCDKRIRARDSYYEQKFATLGNKNNTGDEIVTCVTTPTTMIDTENLLITPLINNRNRNSIQSNNRNNNEIQPNNQKKNSPTKKSNNKFQTTKLLPTTSTCSSTR